MLVWAGLVAAGLALVAWAGSGSITSSMAQEPARSDWPSYGGDAGGSRYSPLDQIRRGNVGELEVAWTFRTGELGLGARDGGDLTFETTPIHFEGRLFLTTGYNEVIALDPTTGDVVWRFDAGVDHAETYSEVTSRGVSGWRDPEASAGAPCAARIFTGTIDGRLIALDAASGRPCASFGDGGEVALWRLAGVEPGEVGDYQVTSAPAVVRDRLVVGPSSGDNWSVDTGDGSVRAFDTRTGKPVWEWSPLEGRAVGRVGAANAWSTMSVDNDRGLVFIPTGSSSPDFFGGLRPGDGRWANSVVALDATSGRLVWGFQTVHHDLFDYDLAAQPTLATVIRGGSEVPILIQPTKTGLVFVLDREDGTPFFGAEERPVPTSDIPGEVAWPTQPYPLAPAPLIGDAGVDPARPWGPNPDHVAECARLALGFRYSGVFTPASFEGSLMYPGNGAGTNWGSGAVDRRRELFVVPTTRFGTLVRLIDAAAVPDSARRMRETGDDGEIGRQRGAPYAMLRRTWALDGTPCTPPPFGVLTALELATGAVRWRIPLGETDAGLPSAGGPIVTGGDLVFMAGTPDQMIRAYDVDTGAVLWRAALPRAGIATPMTYLGTDGRQYVVVAAGGHGKWGLEAGDHVIAFALPR
jgi:quinoprotein glucose dehydrogenase